MAIYTQQSFEFGVYGDGTSRTATFNLAAAPFTTGVDVIGLDGLNFAGALGVGTPSSVVVQSFTDSIGTPNPGGITVQASLLISSLTLTFSAALPNDGQQYHVEIGFTYNG